MARISIGYPLDNMFLLFTFKKVAHYKKRNKRKATYEKKYVTLQP